MERLILERGCDGWCDTSRELKGDEWFEQDTLPGVYHVPGRDLRAAGVLEGHPVNYRGADGTCALARLHVLQHLSPFGTCGREATFSHDLTTHHPCDVQETAATKARCLAPFDIRVVNSNVAPLSVDSTDTNRRLAHIYVLSEGSCNPRLQACCQNPYSFGSL